MNMSNSFQATSPNGTTKIGSREISKIMMPPAKMLPKSRSASVSGFANSSITLIGRKNGNGLK